MQWVKLQLSTLRNQRFTECEPVAQACWLHLLAYCADQENGGRIIGAKSWGDRMWMRSVGITKAEAMLEQCLWEWDADDLVLWGYCLDEEASLRKRRQAGKKGGQATRKQSLSNASSKAEALPQEKRRDKRREEETYDGEAHPAFTPPSQTQPVRSEPKEFDPLKQLSFAGAGVGPKTLDKWLGVAHRAFSGDLGAMCQALEKCPVERRKWAEDFEGYLSEGNAPAASNDRGYEYLP